MKTLQCLQPRELKYLAREKPELKADQAIIKIKRVGICGTDLHAFEGTQPYFNYPRVLGHEIAGELVDADNAPGFNKGDIVTIIPYFNCGSCIACRNGKPNCCVQMQVCGVHTDGGLTEYLAVPSSSLLQSQGLPLDELALVEPLAIGAHGVGRALVEAGEFVLVIGAGPIGLGTIEFARIAGGRVIVMDANEQRLQFCKNWLHVDHSVNASSPDVLEIVRGITSGDMPTVVIDATGNLSAINKAFQFMAHGARYILIGLQKEDISFSHPEFHKREATLMSSRNATAQDFQNVIGFIKKGEVKPSNYITHRVAFGSVASKFESWLHPASGVIKAMVEFD